MQPDGTPDPAGATDGTVREQETYISPTRLEITPSEMEIITEMAPLLGRSPHPEAFCQCVPARKGRAL